MITYKNCPTCEDNKIHSSAHACDVCRVKANYDALIERGYEENLQIQAHIQALEIEIRRLEDALKHIAAGNISPAMDFAKHVLDGATHLEAHKMCREKYK